MQIVIIEPNEKARIEEIGGSLREMQQIVGGCIESVPFEDLPELRIVCNEEGKLLGLEDNFINYDDIICGTAFICKNGKEDFAGLTDDEAEQVLELFNGIAE